MDQSGFGAGTSIATQDGMLPIEWLEPGDRLLDRDGGTVALLSVGRRVLAYPGSLGQPGNWPCEIRHGAPHLCGGLAERLHVAPGQLLLVGGAAVELTFGVPEALVRARDLGPGHNRRMALVDVTLYQLCLERPALIFANGLWCAVGESDGEGGQAPRSCLTAWEAALLADGAQRHAASRRRAA